MPIEPYRGDRAKGDSISSPSIKFKELIEIMKDADFKKIWLELPKKWYALFLKTFPNRWESVD